MDNNKRFKILAIILISVGVLLLAGGAAFSYFENHGKVRSGAVIPDSSEAEKESLLTETEGKNENAEVTGGELSEAENPSEDSTGGSEKDAGGEPGSEVKAEEEPEIVLTENPYKEYFLENPDMAAWIVVDDTPIDYPVMWTPDDEEYYLKRDFNKKSNAAGCLLLDTDSCVDPLTTNLIIHGHNMKDGSMFGSLLKYEKEDYLEGHRIIRLFGRDCEHIYEVMAVFRSKVFYATDDCFKFYKFFDAKSKEEFDDFYDNVKEMSVYDTGVTAEYGDRFITLSTCAYHTENGRFVVVAKEIEPGGFYEPFE
ncbi:MAG: class B sortase [Lachnospiraceae bacterium]|nr:class B sortase [Lachnospiraceae bacterium]